MKFMKVVAQGILLPKEKEKPQLKLGGIRHYENIIRENNGAK